MCSLIMHILVGLGKLDTFLEEHVAAQRFLTMKKSGDWAHNDPKIYIIIQFWKFTKNYEKPFLIEIAVFWQLSIRLAVNS